VTGALKKSFCHRYQLSVSYLCSTTIYDVPFEIKTAMFLSTKKELQCFFLLPLFYSAGRDTIQARVMMTG
jgi:hypothetical protein